MTSSAIPLPGRAVAAAPPNTPAGKPCTCRLHALLVGGLLLAAAAAQGQENADVALPMQVSGFVDVTQPVTIGDWRSTPVDPRDDQDDSRDLQELIDRLARHGQGGTLYFPNGVYYLATPLVIPPNHAAVSKDPNVPLFGITLLGASLGTTLYSVNARGALIVDGASSDSVAEGLTFVRRLCVRNLRMVDHQVHQPDWKVSRRGVGIQLKSAEYCVFENVEVLGFDVGIQLLLGSPNNCFTNISVQLPRTYGIWISSEDRVQPAGPRAWHTDNFWTNVRVTGHNSFEADPSGRPEAGIKISGPCVGDQQFVQTLVGYCKIGMHLLGLPGVGAVEPYRNDIKLSSFIADMNQQEGLRIDHVSNVRISDAFVGVRGITILDASEILISNSWFNGDRTKWPPAGLLTALEVHNASGIGVTNCTFRGFECIGNFVNVNSSTVSDAKIHCSTPCLGDFIGFRLGDERPSAPYVQGSADNSFVGNIFVLEPDGSARRYYGFIEQATGVPGFDNQYVHNRFRGAWAQGHEFIRAGPDSKWVQ